MPRLAAYMMVLCKQATRLAGMETLVWSLELCMPLLSFANKNMNLGGVALKICLFIMKKRQRKVSERTRTLLMSI